MSFNRLRINSNNKIKVHMLNFWGPLNSHIEIILEQAAENDTKKYYQISINEIPKDTAVVNEPECLYSLQNASESHTIEVAAEMDDMIQRWKQKYQNELDDFGCLSYNCADITAWFMETFVNIPKRKFYDKPVTCNYFCCGFFVPSFLQGCLPTLPGRVYDYVKTTSETNTTMDEKTPLLQKPRHS